MKKLLLFFGTLSCCTFAYSQANFSLQAGLSKSIYPSLSKYNIQGIIAPIFQFSGTIKASENFFLGAKFGYLKLGTENDNGLGVDKQTASYLTLGLVFQGAIHTGKNGLLKIGPEFGIITNRNSRHALTGLGVSESIFLTKTFGIIISSDPFLIGSSKDNYLTVSLPFSIGITLNQF